MYIQPLPPPFYSFTIPHPHGTRRFLTMARADINCTCLFGGAKSSLYSTIHVRAGESRAAAHGLESATRPIDGGMALHRSQRRGRRTQAGSGMSRAPINAPMTVQAPRESVVQCSVGSPLLAVCLYFLPVPFRHPPRPPRESQDDDANVSILTLSRLRH